MVRKTILIADDEPMNQMILEELLEEQYEIICVNNGLECLESVKSIRPDLILMDVTMPEMDGLEACRQIKALDGSADLPIIMVSALASKSEVKMGLESGADAYISKPFKEAELMAVIKNYMK